MFLRFISSTLMVSLFFLSIMYGKQGVASYLTTDAIYHYASEGETNTLLTFLRYGYSIDMMDAYGNTALCQAILNEDDDAIETLLDLGANRNANCLHQIPSEKLYRVGLLNRINPTITARSKRLSPPLASIIWKHKTFWTLGIATAVALIASNSGGGSSTAIPGDPNATNLAKVTEIDAIIQSATCPVGMQLINGVCTTPVVESTTAGKLPVSKELKSRPYYLAEFGGNISTPNNSKLEFEGNELERVIAMQANGVSASALSADKKKVNVDKAAIATNVKGTSITMTENSNRDQGVIAMYATSAGTIINNGDITIISESENESAAMKSDRLISSAGVPGTGANLSNNGTITVIDKGNGSGTVSAISTPGRGVTNNGIINLVLNTQEEFTSSKGNGTIQGIYGKNIVNKGTINLTTDSGDTSIHSQAYLIRGFNDQGSVVANDGTLNFSLTNITDGIKGLWSDASNNVGVTIKNTGTINVSGILYNTQLNPKSKQVYLMGSEGGIGTTTNYGTLQVGKKDTPIDVSNGGFLTGMNGANGSLINENIINFHLYADPSLSSNAFTAQAMSLANGEMTNNKEINFTFNNVKGDEKSTSPIELAAMESFVSDPSGDNYATLTNNGTIDADLTGSAGSGFFAAMKSANGSLTNNKEIKVTSNMDNLAVVGLKSETGTIANTEGSEIILTTTGNNADMIGGYSTGGDSNAQNNGSVYLKHIGGSGNITGFGAENNGLIQIEALDMTGQSKIKGGVSYSPVSETVEDPLEDVTETEKKEDDEEGDSTAEETTTKAQGKTNITLTGRTAGEVIGFEYENGNSLGITSHNSANTINITANSTKREGDLSIYGIYTGAGTDTSRDGILTINATGNNRLSLLNVPEKTEIYGLYAKDANITNKKTSVVNLNLDLNGSTNYFVSGMTAVDSSIKQYEPDDSSTTRSVNNGYRAYNAGTLNINVSGTSATGVSANSKIPFDVVGMLTNSYALNTGTIKLNIDYDTATGAGAKTAGMVAYDGGIIANQGTIVFTGNPDNFTPMYATGNNRLYNVETTDTSTTTTTEDYFATVYNSGKIIVNQVIDHDEFEPEGDGYYQKDNPTKWYNVYSEKWEDLDNTTTAEEAWARKKVTIKCDASGCKYVQGENYDTRPGFEKFSTLDEEQEDPTTTLTVVGEIDAITQSASCPEGMELINGVCTTPVLDSENPGEEAVSVERNTSPYYLAEFGGSISTPKNSQLEFEGSTAGRVIAMQANGVSADALSEERQKIDLNKASIATNVKGTSITMTEKSDQDKGVIGMYATSAGTIVNEGDITIISESESESAAMKSDRLISSSGVPGTGANIFNNGTISIMDKGNGSGIVSAISAPGRGITNNGDIHLLLNTTEEYDTSKGNGIVQGIYGKNVVNKGTINLATNSGNKSINSQVYLIRGFNDQGSVIANDGTLSIDLTNIAYGIKGLWSDASNNVGVTIKNTGIINLSGVLYNNLQNPLSKQVYLMGSEGGIATTTNYGTIQVGTKDTPIDIGNGGILIAMNGANGSLINENLINFHLYADPSVSTNSFIAQAMSLTNGQMINNKEINFTFNNEKGNEKSNCDIQLSTMESIISDPSGDNYVTLTNNGTINADLTGSADSGSFAAMKSVNGGLTNNGEINVTSNMDNLDLVGLKSETGTLRNTASGEIILTTTGENANLIGGYSEGGYDNAQNSGSIYLKHIGGSGDITGFAAQNNGLIQIEAIGMSGSSKIIGGVTGIPVSESVEDPIKVVESVEPDSIEENNTYTTTASSSKTIQAKTNISLTGTTSGTVVGYQYVDNERPGTTTHKSANTINITAQDKARVGDLDIGGILSTEKTNTYRDGIITINAVGSPNNRTTVYGLYAQDGNLTNQQTSVVNLNLDLNGSTNHFVSGMAVIDSTIKQYDPADETTVREENNGYRAYNAGTLNLTVTGTSHTTEYDEKIPFDVVGMVTNSYALNTGTIKLDVDYDTKTGDGAKAAGMVAYDGGIIANQGTIIFTGNPDNFTPMYATGNNRVQTVDTPADGSTITSTTDYYATVYNSGKIIVNQLIDQDTFSPAGDGYYKKENPRFYYDVNDDEEPLKLLDTSVSAEDAWARNWEIKTETTSEQEVEIKDENEQVIGTKKETITETETETGDTRPYFEKFTTLPNEEENEAEHTVSKVAAFQNLKTSDQGLKTTEIQNLTKNTTNTLKINDGMRYVSELGGSFIAEGSHLAGDITAGQSLVMSGNKDTYLANGDGQGALIGDGSTSDLSLASNSILFNAQYAQNSNNKNGIDIVMTRKSFNELVANASLATYLENNYKLGNNETFFNQLKANTNLSSLTNSLNKLTGKGVMTRFNFEDMTLMRELNYNLNENIFHSKEPVLSMAGTLNPISFKGGATSQSKYSLLNKKSSNMSVGLAMAYTKLKSNDTPTDDDHQETMYQMVVPMNFNLGQASLMTSPRFGYAYGNYKRTGFNDESYKGHVEKRIYGLMNEARYPIQAGNWLIEPSMEFNVLGYTQKGHEDAKDFALNIKSQNTYSVESGVGLYLTREEELGEDEKLKLTLGAAAYHEFADPYRLDVGMNGMQGAFTLEDEETSQNHAITRFGIDYINKNYSVYGAFTSYWDKETNSLFKSGLKMNF